MAPNFLVEPTGQEVSKNISQKNPNSNQMMADSEGYGSSGRVDTEITASEDFCAPRRKSVNFHNNSHQQFSIPLQVLSLSKMSSFERKQLELRLKRELEQVRTFQKNLEQALSSSSDVYSCSAGQRKPVPDLTRSMLSKKRAPPGRVGNWNAGLMKQCETLLNRLMGYKFGWVFNTPVDAVALKIPDYYTVIKHPMDLGTVKTKLKSKKYVDPWGFASDIRLTFSNAMTYNPRGNDVHIMAETLSKFFEVRWNPIEKKIQKVLEAESVTVMPPFKKKKTTSFTNEIKQEPIKKIMMMTVAEIQKLSGELESSIAELPENIIDFLKENSSNKNATMDDEIEIDIDALGDDTLFKLRKLLDDFLVEKLKNMETCEIELHNESGVSNSSMQEVKVNDANEEEIDIGGNDLPISSFPTVKIEKDNTAVRNSKCSSSSSSSSDSGSSSSESDSDNSSGSESHGEKAVNNVKDTLGSEVDMEQITVVPRDTEDCVNGVEQKCQSDKDGESESGRQVSPDKLYRAALLRSRFADTILKAQEKTLGKVEKRDVERLRLDKEEVEKRRNQEKARMEAEARAAEVQAVAEAKRKLQLEREAAREAILKMEKMVDINGNSGRS